MTKDEFNAKLSDKLTELGIPFKMEEIEDEDGKMLGVGVEIDGAVVEGLDPLVRAELDRFKFELVADLNGTTASFHLEPVDGEDARTNPDDPKRQELRVTVDTPASSMVSLMRMARLGNALCKAAITVADECRERDETPPAAVFPTLQALMRSFEAMSDYQVTSYQAEELADLIDHKGMIWQAEHDANELAELGELTIEQILNETKEGR